MPALLLTSQDTMFGTTQEWCQVSVSHMFANVPQVQQLH